MIGGSFTPQLPKTKLSIYEVSGVGGVQILNDIPQSAWLVDVDRPNADFASANTGTTYSGVGGDFDISYKIFIMATDPNNRSTIFASIFINGIEIERSRSAGYSRSLTNGEDSMNGRIAPTLANGDVISVRAWLKIPSDAARIVLSYSNMLFLEA